MRFYTVRHSKRVVESGGRVVPGLPMAFQRMWSYGEEEPVAVRDLDPAIHGWI